MTLQKLRRVAEELRAVLADFEPERLTGPDAARMLAAFSEIEKLASGGKLLSARRVETSNVWRRKGHRSAAAHVAEATGVGLGPAIHALKAARQLGSLPTTEEALRDGRLSEVQVKEITDAAIHQPEAERELVDTAQKEPLNLLKLRCRRVKATQGDQHRAYAAIHRSRFFRHWTDDDGAVRFDARLTPDEGARVVASIKNRSGPTGCRSPAGRSRRTTARPGRRCPGPPHLWNHAPGGSRNEGRHQPRGREERTIGSRVGWRWKRDWPSDRTDHRYVPGRRVYRRRPHRHGACPSRPSGSDAGIAYARARYARFRASAPSRSRSPAAWPSIRSSACW